MSVTCNVFTNMKPVTCSPHLSIHLLLAQVALAETHNSVVNQLASLCVVEVIGPRYGQLQLTVDINGTTHRQHNVSSCQIQLPGRYERTFRAY